MAGVVALVLLGGLPVVPEVHTARATHDGVATDAAGVAMVMAMMAPLAIPMCSDVARASLWWRRSAAVTAALATFLAVWAVAAVVLHRAVGLLITYVPAGAVVAVAAALCAHRQFDRQHQRRIDRCHRPRPLRPRRIARDAATWGGGAAAQCIRVCTLPMILTAVVVGWPVLLAVTGVLAVERHYYPRPRRRLAWAYVVLGVALSAFTLRGLVDRSPDLPHHHPV